MIGRPSDAAKAPKGSWRPDSVPTIQLVRSPEASALARTSRASRVLPTPHAPTITNSAERAPDGTQFAIPSGQRVAGGHGPVADAKAGSICRAESLRRFER